MAPSRPGGACLLVGALTLTGCASSVAWPPQAGSCIEATRAHRRRAPWRYTIDGHAASRGEVENVVFAPPAWQEKARKFRTLDTLAPGLFIGGDALAVGGTIAAVLSHRSGLVVLPVVGLVTSLVGLIMGVTTEDPLHPAIVELNNSPRRFDVCPPKPFAPPVPFLVDEAPPHPSPRPPPPYLPALPQRGWEP
jgi:hypothetical protein